MQLIAAQERDYPAIVELANLAYRGGKSWNSETALIEGARLTEPLLRQDLAAAPEARLLAWRDTADGEVLGTVWLEPKSAETWYLGLLTIQPELQANGQGRTLLAAAEDYVREHGGACIRMTVIYLRESLIAWYLRRGYKLTGETEPFPYGDDRFGKPLRDDLHFVVLEKEL